MYTSQYWFNYFDNNLKIKRIDWSLAPSLNEQEKKCILRSLQAWQLGETSEGTHLLAAAKKYAKKIDDNYYPEAIKLFIKEEQKHGNNLGRYLDLIGEKRIQKNWGDSLFRKVRYFNTSMELWTLAVISVESTAQVFYQSLKDATGCALLKQVCTDILIDEAPHIEFQLERMTSIYEQKNRAAKVLYYYFYLMSYFAIITLVWLAHKRLFKSGGNGLFKYYRKMSVKFKKTFVRMRDTAGNSLPEIKMIQAVK